MIIDMMEERNDLITIQLKGSESECRLINCSIQEYYMYMYMTCVKDFYCL